MQFVKEYNELTERGISLKGKIFCDHRVRWSTPYDMMANQIIEHLRGKDKHGSCGMGIWETVLRYHNSEIEDIVKFAAFVNMPLMDKLAYLTKVKNIMINVSVVYRMNGQQYGIVLHWHCISLRIVSLCMTILH